jgi:hypothetical protein
MNIDFKRNTFLNIIENIFSNNIVNYIIPKKDNLNKFGKILPLCEESCNYSQELSQDLLEYEILNNNKFSCVSNNEFNSTLNNKLNNENDKYKFKYDIENGLYDIEIGYISLMENSLNNNKDKEIYFNNSINEMNSISGNYDNIYVIDCFDNEDI